LRPGIQEDVQVSCIEVGEAVLVQPFEHARPHCLPGDT
jgi:hypothetical protein